MGIDALDIAFRLERRFGIEICKAEAQAVLFDTAGTVHRYLVAKLQDDYRQTPRIEPLFLGVSQAVNQITGRWRLATSLDLNRRFSPATRAENWHALEETLGVSLPELEERANEDLPRIPRQCDSVISLSYWIAEQHPERVEWIDVSCERTGEMATHLWSEVEVWHVLRECISDSLGVNPEEVTPDTRMVEDLGMD